MYQSFEEENSNIKDLRIRAFINTELAALGYLNSEPKDELISGDKPN